MSRREAWLAALALAALTALRLVVAGYAPLSPDEAYYWVWSRALAPGYLDHPAMVALWIRAGTALLGPTALGVRLLGPLSAAAGTWLLWQAGRDLLDARAGLLAAAGLNATLVLGLGGLSMTPDTPLLFFWIATLAATARLVRTGDARWWLAVGIAAGLALDSKYTAALLPAGLLVWVGWTRQWRALRRPEPWLGAALGLALFLPTLAWNAAHGFASFAKQGGRTLDFSAVHALRFEAELLGGQIGLATPLLFVLGVAGVAAAAATAWRGRDPARSLIAIFACLPALLFVEHALGDRVQANWPAILYPAAMLALKLAPGRMRRLLRPGLALGVAMSAVLYVQVLAAPVKLPERLDPFRRIEGFDTLAREAAARLAADPTARFLAVDEYGTASLIAMLAPGCLTVVAVEPRWALFRLPSAGPLLAGQQGLLLRSSHRLNPPDREGWASFTPEGRIERPGPGGVAGGERVFQVRAGAVAPVGAVLPCGR